MTPRSSKGTRRSTSTSAISSRSRKSSKSKALPPPTPSEEAFERALASLLARDGETSAPVTPSLSREAHFVIPSLSREANHIACAQEITEDPSTSPALPCVLAQGDNEGSGSRLRAFLDDAFARREEYARDAYASIGDAASFHSKIVGVLFEGRQDTIVGLREGAALQLVREPEHEKDRNAIAIFYGNLRLGYVRAGIAKHLAPLIDAGARYRARIENLTGGGARHRGVNIIVERDAAATIARRVHVGAEQRASLGTADRTADAVRRALIGDCEPHVNQHDVLERLDRGENTLALFGTGRGKSFCFQYPAALRALAGNGHKTLAIYPLRALANDQYEALQRRLEQFGLLIFRANGAIGAQEREDLFEALREGAWDLVLATPEFLAYHRALFTGRSTPSLVVVDEAHHVHESRHRPAYAALGESIASLGEPQILALTATAGEEAFARIRASLRIGAWVIDPTIRENLHLVDARKEREKAAYLHRIFESGEKGIVYCNSREQVGKIAEQLRRGIGDCVMFYHAGMPSPKRHEVEDLFRDGALRVVVATSAFGEGIDLPDVRHVVLYHLNFSFTEFNQQAGRAGRDGAPAFVHLLFNERDRRLNEFIIERESPALPVLRRIYGGAKTLARNGVLRASAGDIARELDERRLHERTVTAAMRIFEDEGLIEVAQDDEGRYLRFLPVHDRVDLTRNERFAEGEAERESFSRFADMALSARVEDLERLVNRPIYPDVALVC